MKLTIVARSHDDFGVILITKHQHKSDQKIFSVTVTDADLHELTETRVDKEHLIEFAFQFLVDHEPISAIQSRFNIAVISTYFPEFPAVVKQWVAENT
jgi:hypothetical protein